MPIKPTLYPDIHSTMRINKKRPQGHAFAHAVLCPSNPFLPSAAKLSLLLLTSPSQSGQGSGNAPGSLCSAPTAPHTYPHHSSYHTALKSSICVSVSPAAARSQRARNTSYLPPLTQTEPTLNATQPGQAGLLAAPESVLLTLSPEPALAPAPPHLT